MHLKEREKLMNAVYTCPKLQKWTYFLLKKKGSMNPYTFGHGQLLFSNQILKNAFDSKKTVQVHGLSGDMAQMVELLVCTHLSSSIPGRLEIGILAGF